MLKFLLRLLWRRRAWLLYPQRSRDSTHAKNSSELLFWTLTYLTVFPLMRKICVEFWNMSFLLELSRDVWCILLDKAVLIVRCAFTLESVRQMRVTRIHHDLQREPCSQAPLQLLVHNVCTLAMWLYKTRDEPRNEATFMIVQHHTSMHTPHACTPHTQHLWHLGLSGSGMPCKITVLHVCGWSTKDLCASVYWRSQSVIHTVHKLVNYYVAWLCSMP